jgi:hypothetical protein
MLIFMSRTVTPLGWMGGPEAEDLGPSRAPEREWSDEDLDDGDERARFDDLEPSTSTRRTQPCGPPDGCDGNGCRS